MHIGLCLAEKAIIGHVTRASSLILLCIHVSLSPSLSLSIYIYPIAFGLPATVPCIGSIKIHMYWLIEGAQVLTEYARIKG